MKSGHIYDLSTWKSKIKRLAWATKSYLSYLRVNTFPSLSAVMLFWAHTGLEELCWMVVGFLFNLPCSVCLESPLLHPHTPGRRRDWWENKSTAGHLYFKQSWVPAALPGLLTSRVRMKPALFLTEWMNNAERPAQLLALMCNKLLTLILPDCNLVPFPFVPDSVWF